MTSTPNKIVEVARHFRETRAEIDRLPDSEAKSKALAALERAVVEFAGSAFRPDAETTTARCARRYPPPTNDFQRLVAAINAAWTRTRGRGRAHRPWRARRIPQTKAPNPGEKEHQMTDTVQLYCYYRHRRQRPAFRARLRRNLHGPG